jgi:hypothetical protein
MRGADSGDDVRMDAYLGNASGIDSTYASATMGRGGPRDDGLGDQGAGELNLRRGLVGLSPLVTSVVGAVVALALLWPIALADPKPLTLWAIGGGAGAFVALTYSSRTIRSERARRTRDWVVARAVRTLVIATVAAVPLIWLLA